MHRYNGSDEYQEADYTAINDLYDIQLECVSDSNNLYSPDTNIQHTQIRNLQATDISKLVRVEGIIINASRTNSKVIRAYMQCTNCRNETSKPVKPGFSGIQMPTRCETYVF